MQEFRLTFSRGTKMPWLCWVFHPDKLCLRGKVISIQAENVILYTEEITIDRDPGRGEATPVYAKNINAMQCGTDAMDRGPRVLS